MRSGESVYLYTGNDRRAEQLDKLMWTFRQGSFVPHELWRGQEDALQTPALIGTQAPPDDHHAVLINLAEDVPGFFSQYERVLELVDGQNPDPGRQRYKYYKDRGYTLDMHKIQPETGAR